MDLAQTVTNAIVVGAVGIILAFLVHGVRGEIQALRGEVQALRGEVRQDIADVRREIGDLRSDLTQVALAVGARPRAERNR